MQKKLNELSVTDDLDDDIVMHVDRGRPRIETTKRGRLLAAAMTKIAEPCSETNSRRRAEENIVNQIVKGFAEEVNEYTSDQIGTNTPKIAASTMYTRTSYTTSVSILALITSA